MTEIIVTTEDNELDGVKLRRPPPPSYPALNLEHLTEEERNMIWRVVNRDEAIRIKEEHRINRLKAELHFLKRKSALKPDMDNQGNRCCVRCQIELGLIINRGALCKMCHQKVCKSCREYNLSGTDWVCSVCQKNLELQLATGEWMNEFVRKPSRRRDKVYVPTSDVVKSGIRRSWTISNPSGDQSQATGNKYRSASFLQVEPVDHTNVSSSPTPPPPASSPHSPPPFITDTDRALLRRRSSFTTVDHHMKYMKGPAPPPPDQRHSAPVPQNRLAPPEIDYHLPRSRPPKMGDIAGENWRYRNSHDADVSSNCTSLSCSPRTRDSGLPSEMPWRNDSGNILNAPHMRSCQNLNSLGGSRDVRIPRCPSVGSYDENFEGVMMRRRQMMTPHLSPRDKNNQLVSGGTSPDRMKPTFASPGTSSEVSPVMMRPSRLNTGSSLYDSGVYEDEHLSPVLRPSFSSATTRTTQRINSDSDQAYGGSSPSQSSADPYFGYSEINPLGLSVSNSENRSDQDPSVPKLSIGRRGSHGSGDMSRIKVHPRDVKIEMKSAGHLKTSSLRRVNSKSRVRPDAGNDNCRYWQRLEEAFDSQFRRACQYVNNDNEPNRSKVEIRNDMSSDYMRAPLSARDASCTPVESGYPSHKHNAQHEVNNYKLVFISSDSSKESGMDDSFERIMNKSPGGSKCDLGTDNKWDFHEVTNSKLIPLIQRQKYRANRKLASDKKYRLASLGQSFPPLIHHPHYPRSEPPSDPYNDYGLLSTVYNKYEFTHNPSPTRSIEEMESCDHTRVLHAEGDVWSSDKSLHLSVSEPNLTDLSPALQVFLKRNADDSGPGSIDSGHKAGYCDPDVVVDRRSVRTHLRIASGGDTQPYRPCHRLTRSQSSCASLLSNRTPNTQENIMYGKSPHVDREVIYTVSSSPLSRRERRVDNTLGFNMPDSSKSLSETDLSHLSLEKDRSNPFAGYESVTRVRVGKLKSSAPRRKHRTNIHRSHSAAAKYAIPVKCYFPSDKPSFTTHLYNDGQLPAANISSAFSSSHTSAHDHVSNVEIRKSDNEGQRPRSNSDLQPGKSRNLRVKSFSEGSRSARFVSAGAQDGTTRVDLYNHNSVKEKVDIYNMLPFGEKKVSPSEHIEPSSEKKVVLKFEDLEDNNPGLTEESLKDLASSVNLSWKNYSNKPYQSASLPRMKTKFSPVQEYVKIFEQKIGETKGSTLPRAFSNTFKEDSYLNIADKVPEPPPRTYKHDNCYANKNSIRIKIAASRSTGGSDTSDSDGSIRPNSVPTRSNDPIKSKLYPESQRTFKPETKDCPLLPNNVNETVSSVVEPKYNIGAVGSVHWRTPKPYKQLDPRPITVGASTDEDEESVGDKVNTQRTRTEPHSSTDETNKILENYHKIHDDKSTLNVPRATIGDRPEKMSSDQQLLFDENVSVHYSHHQKSDTGLVSVSAGDLGSKLSHSRPESSSIVTYYERLRDKEVNESSCPAINEVEQEPTVSSDTGDTGVKSDSSKHDSDTEADFLDRDVKKLQPANIEDVTSSTTDNSRRNNHSPSPQTESVSRENSPRQVSPQPVTPFTASLVSDDFEGPVENAPVFSDSKQVDQVSSATSTIPVNTPQHPNTTHVTMPSPVDARQPEAEVDTTDGPRHELPPNEDRDACVEEEENGEGEPSSCSASPVPNDGNICASEREGSQHSPSSPLHSDQLCSVDADLVPSKALVDSLVNLQRNQDNGETALNNNIPISTILENNEPLLSEVNLSPDSVICSPSYFCNELETNKLVLNSDNAVTIVNVDFGAKKRAQDGVTVIKINPGSEDQIISSDEGLFVSDQSVSPSNVKRKQYSVTTLTIGHSSGSDCEGSSDDLDIEDKYRDAVVTVIHEHSTSGVVKQKMNTLKDRKKFGYKSISESVSPGDLHSNVSQLEELTTQPQEKSSEAWSIIKDGQSDSPADQTVSGLTSYFMLSLENSPAVKKTPVVVSRKPVLETKHVNEEDSEEMIEEMSPSPPGNPQLDFILPSGDEDPENFKVYTSYMEADDESSGSDNYGRVESAEEMDYCYSDSVSSGDDGDFDREEELRGYNRGFDFTLHTIMEESCEESDSDKKRIPSVHHNPSELEKYFCYDIGDGMTTEKRFANEESEYSDTFSETSSSVFSEGLDPLDKEDTSIDPAELASSRLEKYFLTDFLGMDRQISFDDEEHSENQSDENGSVGSDSEGQPSPEQKRKKVMKTRAHRSNSHENVLRAFVFRSDSIGSEESNYSNDGEETRKSLEVERSHGENEDEKAFEKSDGQFDTIKRRKKKKSCSDFSEPKSDSDRKSETDKKVSQSPSQSTDETSLEVTSTENPANKISSFASLLAFESTSPVNKQPMGLKSDKPDAKSFDNDEKQDESIISVLNVTGTSSSERRKLRDSGFVGSSDDLLKDGTEYDMGDKEEQQEEEDGVPDDEELLDKQFVSEPIAVIDGLSSDEPKDEIQNNLKAACNDNGSDRMSEVEKDKLEGLSSTPSGKSSRSSSTTDSPVSPLIRTRCKVIRKDSFNNWSSDEETNLMMSKMRVFFRNLFTNSNKGQKVKPPQLIEFEARLTTLMKTVPGINDEQVKEIVEYLSSEDTWSDSYDSSDYTSSDLEGAYAVLKLPDRNINPEIQQQISASCQEIIQKFDQSLEDSPESDGLHSPTNSESSAKETALVYQKLLSSFSRFGALDNNSNSQQLSHVQSSPPLIAKVFHHIGNRLVDLMHEVSTGEPYPGTCNGQDLKSVRSETNEQFATSSPKTKSSRRKIRKYPVSPSDLTSQANYFSFEHIQSYSDLTSDSDEASTPKATPKSPEFISPASTLKRDSNFSSPASTLEKPLNGDKMLEPPDIPTVITFSSDENHRPPFVSTSLPPILNKRDTDVHLLKDSTSRISLSPTMTSHRSEDRVEIVLGSLNKYPKSPQKSESLNDLLEPNKMSDFSSSECLSDSTLKALDSAEQLSSDYQASWMSDEQLAERKSKSTQNVSCWLSPPQPEDISVSETDLSTAKSNSERKPRSKLLDIQSKRRKSVPDTSVSDADTSSRDELDFQTIPTKERILRGSYTPASIGSNEKSLESLSPSTTSGSVRSARYRPPGYKPPPSSPRRSTTNLSSHSYGSFTNSEDSASHISGESASVNVSSSENVSLLSPPEVPTAAGSAEEDIDRWVAVHKKDHRTPSVTRSDSVSSVCSVVSDIHGTVSTVPVRGEIQLAMQYNPQNTALEILVKQCRDLAPVDTKRNRSDPYVKVYLLPDKTKSGKRKTKVRKHTLNPVFDECLRFPCVRTELNTRSIWVTVWHSDMFGRNDFLGEVTIELDEKAMSNPTPIWYKLQERVESLLCDASSLKLGNIIVALKYLPADKSDKKLAKTTFPATSASHGSLQILVKEAKNLKTVQGHCDAFCKCYLLPERGKNSKQKTIIVRRTASPSWNHTFVYEDMTYDELKDKCIELSIWDHDRLSSNTFLGGVRLNLGCGKINGKSVDWMDSNDEESSLWRSMIERPAMWVQASLPLRTVVKHGT